VLRESHERRDARGVGVNSGSQRHTSDARTPRRHPIRRATRSVMTRVSTPCVQKKTMAHQYCGVSAGRRSIPDIARCAFAICGLVVALSACSRSDARPAAAAGSTATPTLDGVRRKNFVQCGVTTGVAGFSTPDAQGQWRGLDVDVCRAIAAAVFGDATKVRFTPLTAAQRFTALQTGEVDVLSRITTITFQRDVQLGIEFPAINWYDDTTFIVRTSSH